MSRPVISARIWEDGKAPQEWKVTRRGAAAAGETHEPGAELAVEAQRGSGLEVPGERRARKGKFRAENGKMLNG